MTDIENKLTAMLKTRASNMDPGDRLHEIQSGATNVDLVPIRGFQKQRRYGYGLACALLMVGLIFAGGSFFSSDDKTTVAQGEDILSSDSTTSELTTDGAASYQRTINFFQRRAELIRYAQTPEVVAEFAESHDVVIGRVVGVKPGSAYLDAPADGDETGSSVTDWANKEASWRTFNLVVEAEQHLQGSTPLPDSNIDPGSTVLIEVSVSGDDVNGSVVEGFQQLGRSAFFVDGLSITGEQGLLRLGMNGSLVATLVGETIDIDDFPLADSFNRSRWLPTGQEALATFGR